MRHSFPRILVSTIVLPAILAVVSAAQELPVTNPPQTSHSDEKQHKKEMKRAKHEMSDSLQPILEEMSYLFTPDERETLKHLATNEEREQFIELIFIHHNPNPDRPVEEFKEEYYRRIAFANERFSSGIPGWKTDRGHIYIVWGPPDEIESHPTGGTYDRPMWQGGGSTPTYNWELWRYRHLEGVGENIELEFVDPSGSGEYHLTTDPSEKDACTHVPSCGLSISEMLSGRGKTDRFSNSNGTTLPAPLGGIPANEGEFERMERGIRVLGPPPVHYKDITAEVSSRLIRNPINLVYDFAYLRITPDSVFVPITLQIPNGQMGYRSKDGVHSANLNVYARITTPGGKVIQTIEESIAHDVPDSLFPSSLAQSSLYQKSIPLHPGLYRLDVVVKDVESGNIGVIGTALRVPQFESDTLSASSLILADKIESVPLNQIDSGQFVFGPYKVRPRLTHSFASSELLGIFLQLYNLKFDEALHVPDVVVTYRLLRDKKQVWTSVENSNSIRRDGEQLTLNRKLPLAGFSSGHYTLEIEIADRISHQSLTRSADFEISPIHQ